MNGLAFLRKSHGGCKCPPDTCQEPPFESIVKTKKDTTRWVVSFLVETNGLEPSTSCV